MAIAFVNIQGTDESISYKSNSNGKMDPNEAAEIRRKASKKGKISGVDAPDDGGDISLTKFNEQADKAEKKDSADTGAAAGTNAGKTKGKKPNRGKKGADKPAKPAVDGQEYATFKVGEGKEAKTERIPMTMDDVPGVSSEESNDFWNEFKLFSSDAKKSYLAADPDVTFPDGSVISLRTIRSRSREAEGVSEGNGSASDLDDYLGFPPWEDSGYADIDELMHKSRDIDRLIIILMAALKSGNIDVIDDILNLLGMKANLTAADTAQKATKALAKLNDERQKISDEIADLYEDGGDDNSSIGKKNSAIQRARTKLESQDALRNQWLNVLRESSDYRASVLNFAKSWLDSMRGEPMRYIFQ